MSTLALTAVVLVVAVLADAGVRAALARRRAGGADWPAGRRRFPTSARVVAAGLGWVMGGVAGAILLDALTPDTWEAYVADYHSTVGLNAGALAGSVIGAGLVARLVGPAGSLLPPLLGAGIGQIVGFGAVAGLATIAGDLIGWFLWAIPLAAGAGAIFLTDLFGR